MLLISYDQKGAKILERFALDNLHWLHLLEKGKPFQEEVICRPRGNEKVSEILLRIAREFDKSIEWLLTGEDCPKLRHQDCSATRLHLAREGKWGFAAEWAISQTYRPMPSEAKVSRGRNPAANRPRIRQEHRMVTHG